MVSPFLAILIIASCVSGQDKIYVGSTPAAPVVRTFLGIPLDDSIDFIRWKFTVRDNRYQLQCNYGIGKPNTNGFIKGGSKIELRGICTKENNYYQLQNGIKTLKVFELNDDLLHLMNADNSLLAGNGGWSYTLNIIAPSGSDKVNITAPPTIVEDSIAFVGRTPCKVPGVLAPGTACYKLKWSIVLYALDSLNSLGRYKLRGTAWRMEDTITGNWKVITGKDRRTIYQLNDAQGKDFLYLLKLDEHVMIFTNAEGNLLVGDEDFSYTLSRKL